MIKNALMFITGVGMSSIARKWIMSLTGLFLCFFLLGHLMGNLILLSGDGAKEAFNEYAAFMGSNPAVQVLRIVTYAGILFHIFYAIALSIKNKSARKQGYAYTNTIPKNSSLASKIMLHLGAIVLIFLGLHLYSFWYQHNFIGYESLNNIDNLYDLVVFRFSDLKYSAFYVIVMFFLGYHLWHGFQSGFQSLGINHPKYSPLIEKAGSGFAIIIPLGFAVIPVFIYLTNS